MSLLMEALRKAEEEKKRAAQEQQPSSTQEGPATGEVGATRGEAAAAEPGSQTDSLIDTSRLSLEPLESGQPPPVPEANEAGVSTKISLDDLHEPTTRFQRQALADDNEGEAEEATLQRPELQEEALGEHAPEDMESTKPSKKGVQSSLQEYFEASQSMERPRASVGEVDDAATLATPVSANTIFSAKARRSTSRLLAYGAIVILLLATGLGAVGVWYYTRTPATQAPLSPLLASDVEKPAAPPLKLPAVAPPSPVARETVPQAGELAAVASAPAAANAAPAMTPEGAAPESSAMSTAPVEPPPVPAVAAAAPPAKSPAPAVAEAAPAAVGTPSPPATAQKPPTLSWSPPAAASVASDVMPGQLQIKRVPAQLRVNEKVEEAYSAYQAGNMNRAETLYREVLARDPEQHDALLGLAALATRRGDRSEAVAYYNHLLALDPHDRYANAALVSLVRSSDPVNDESRLKSMLADGADSAYLNFMLGNTYARQARWADAQQAYFNAYTHESGNADYVYNLAVSLDHLGQRRAAMDYYQKALSLADKRTTGFTSTQVQQRLQALAGGDTGTSP